MRVTAEQALADLGLTRWPIPAPEHRAERCGCRVPLIWDGGLGVWRHLDDFSRCLPRPTRPPFVVAGCTGPGLASERLAFDRAPAGAGW